MISIGNWWETREPCTFEEFEKSIHDIVATDDDTDFPDRKDRLWHDSIHYIVPKLPYLYDYAFKGIQLSPSDEPIMPWLMDAFHDLVTVVGLQSLFRELTASDYGDEEPPQMVLLACMARMKIDTYLGIVPVEYEDIPVFGMIPEYSDPDFLSIKELALLGNMSERTVNNYRSKSQGSILSVQKQVVQWGRFKATQNVVPVADAYQFLRARRDFIPSRPADQVALELIMK